MAGTDVQPSGQIASLRPMFALKVCIDLRGIGHEPLLCLRRNCPGSTPTVALTLCDRPGGIDPYESQVYEASDSLAINAPLVVERVALAACGTDMTIWPQPRA